jgi:hypothetical protein
VSGATRGFLQDDDECHITGQERSTSCCASFEDVRCLYGDVVAKSDQEPAIRSRVDAGGKMNQWQVYC